MEQVGPYGRAITLIHYVYQDAPERIACMPNMTEFHTTQFHQNYQRSNSTAAVTCPACMRTDAYKLAKSKNA